MNKKVFLFCTGPEWATTLVAGAAAAVLTAPWWINISLWIGVFPALTMATVFHFIFATRHLPPIPHIGILICCLQYGLAPWLSYYFPPDDPFDTRRYIISDYRLYFSYTGPLVVAFALGWLLPLLAYGGTVLAAPLDPGLRGHVVSELDLIFWVGISATLLADRWYGGSLAFFLLLLGNLRFVGAIGQMILGTKGWRWRVALLLLLEAYWAVGSGMFHSLLLWGAAVGAFYACFQRVSRRVLFSAALIGFLLLFALQHAKWQIRQVTWFGTTETIMVFNKEFKFTPLSKPLVGGLCIVEGMWRTLKWDWDPNFVSGTTLRYNQGWIISKVMHHVPMEEPYARGETLWTGITSSMVPRFLAPGKHISGGRIPMLRFAGLYLGTETSMNLGFGGEMYANFGLWGGVLACGLYALVLGVAFLFVASRTRVSVLWWLFIPYVGHWALKAESGIPDVMNFMVKSFMVLLATVFVSPGLRYLMLRNLRQEPALPFSPPFHRPPNLSGPAPQTGPAELILENSVLGKSVLPSSDFTLPSGGRAGERPAAG